MDTFKQIPTSKIDDVKIPIRSIDGATIHDLKESIKLYGIIQPLVVRLKPDNRYEILCGRHRLCAAKGVELDTVSCVVKTNISDDEALFFSLQENIQRLEMDPIKEGEIYFNLLQHTYSTESLMQKLGKSKLHIQSRIQIYKNLHEELKTQIGKTITISNAVALSKLSKSQQLEIHQEILKQVTTKLQTKGYGGCGGWGAPSKFCKCEKCGSKHLKGVSIEE